MQLDLQKYKTGYDLCLLQIIYLIDIGSFLDENDTYRGLKPEIKSHRLAYKRNPVGEPKVDKTKSRLSSALFNSA